MSSRRVALIIAALFVFAPSIRALADETEGKPVAERDVPAAATAAVKKKFPDAKLVHFQKELEHGKTQYEVKIELAAKAKVRKIAVDVSPEGKILAEEEQLTVADLTKEVTKALAAGKYATWTVRGVERVVKNEKDDVAVFELELSNGDKPGGVELTIDPSGKIVAEEAEDGK